MEYRVHQGIELSAVGVGCYALSGAFGRKDVDSIKAVLRRAHEMGVNLFDTAEAYGDAESILGDAVRPFRDEILISTKVGVRSGFKPSLSRDYVKSACEESLKRLGTDWIDIYGVHFDDPETPVHETVDALEDLVKEGRIRKYGLGHLPLKRAVEYANLGSVFSVLMEFSAVSRQSSKDLLSLCIQRDVAAIGFSVTGRGLLTGKINAQTRFENQDIRTIDPQFQRERLEFSLRVAAKLGEMGERHGKAPVQVAIGWAVAQPGMTSVLTGPSSVEHLEENLGGVGWTLSAAELAEINSYLDEHEAWLREAQEQAVTSILHGSISSDVSRAFVDLVYCIETAIGLGRVQEQEVLPIFYELLGLQSRLSETSRSDFERIQSNLREIIPSSQAVL
jgi:aryl-alcohol dehydrogenase-like predicted oxidoreductase